MDKTRALKLLGDLQLDLVKRKKGIESKKEKLVQRKEKIMDNVKYHGGNPSSSAARELEHLKKDISYLSMRWRESKKELTQLNLLEHVWKLINRKTRGGIFSSLLFLWLFEISFYNSNIEMECFYLFKFHIFSEFFP